MSDNFVYYGANGTEWYLHSKEVTLRNGYIQRIYWFAKQAGPETCAMPDGKEVMETERTGMPVLKNI